jgi:spermidine synthase
MFITSILIIGLSGIVAQVVLLRELLVSFYSNELILGLILANWIFLEALGVFAIGKFIDKIKNKINIFVILQVIFSLSLPIAIYLSRVIKPILGVSFGEAVGLDRIFYYSLFIMLPVGFCHGALFSCSSRIYSSFTQDSPKAIGKIYAWETIGTIIGGVALTYFFIPKLNSFQIVFIISIANLIICLLFIKQASRIFKYVVLASIVLIMYIFLNVSPNSINYLAIKKQWQGQKVLDYQNSIYGNIVVAQKDQQRTFFYNGLPIITTPYPDMTFVQEFGNLPLLFHSKAKDILVISSGAGGLINEILKHPIEKLDYAELDPAMIKMLKKYPSVLTQKELSDSRVSIVNKDGRLFVMDTSCFYDVVLLGLSKPSDLSANRLFTQEFFSLVKKRLKNNGILAFYLPGSLTYLSSQLRDLNACILNGLQKTYPYVRIIPGDYNIFLASDSASLNNADSGLIARRLSQDNIKVDILTPGYIDFRLDKKRLEWFNHSLIGATKKVNRDFTPFAVYQMLIFWNKQFSSPLMHTLEALGNLKINNVLLAIFAITAVLFLFFYFNQKLKKTSIAYSIATTGFFGMMISLILIFSFQVIHGYLYYWIGLLISVFMAGAACGSIVMAMNAPKIKNRLSLFIKLELTIIIFTYLAVSIITNHTAGQIKLLLPVFAALFLISGLLSGLEFPLAAKMYLMDKGQAGAASGVLYFCDLMGGWVAGMLGGVVLLPVLGLFNSCLVIIALKLSSLALLLFFSKRLTKSDI